MLLVFVIMVLLVVLLVMLLVVVVVVMVVSVVSVFQAEDFANVVIQGALQLLVARISLVNALENGVSLVAELNVAVVVITNR
jgi:cell division septal protein FtsQ